ncbi:MAG: hypothetical protein AAB567_02995 [Patescibacteria group bacterium]
MDFKEIKDIIQRDGGKFIIVENDEPTLIVMSFGEYKGKFVNRNPSFSNPLRQMGQAVQPPSFGKGGEGKEREELTIDDLPV